MLFSLPSYSQNILGDTLSVITLSFQEYTGRSLKVDHYTEIYDLRDIHNNYYQLIDSTTIPGTRFYSRFIEDDSLSIVGIFVITKKAETWMEFNIDFDLEAQQVKIIPGGKNYPSLFCIEYGSHHYFNRGEEKQLIFEVWDTKSPRRIAQINLETSGYGSYLDVQNGVTTIERIDNKGSVTYNNGILSLSEGRSSSSKIEIDSNEVEKIIYDHEGLNKPLTYRFDNGFLIKQ